METLIKIFLDGSGDGDGDGDGDGYGSGYGYGAGYGYGYGYGSGYGYGCGYGAGDGYVYGSGSGSGSGYGYGYSSGSGDGDGAGSGVLSINNNKIYIIDDIQTIIKSVRGNIAQGFILNADLSLTPTFIVKELNYFAHGETLHKAFSALQAKIMDNMSIEDKIIKFKEKFNDFSKKCPNKDLFYWHHILTGSCEQGRKSFARDHNIDIDNGSMSIYEFIKITENSYNGEIIKKLNGNTLEKRV